MPGPTAFDWSGKRVGRLRVLYRVPNKPDSPNPQWACMCKCGARCIVAASSLKMGLLNNGTGTRSCGCMHMTAGSENVYRLMYKGQRRTRKEIATMMGISVGRLNTRIRRMGEQAALESDH